MNAVKYKRIPNNPCIRIARNQKTRSLAKNKNESIFIYYTMPQMPCMCHVNLKKTPHRELWMPILFVVDYITMKKRKAYIVFSLRRFISIRELQSNEHSQRLKYWKSNSAFYRISYFFRVKSRQAGLNRVKYLKYLLGPVFSCKNSFVCFIEFNDDTFSNFFLGNINVDIEFRFKTNTFVTFILQLFYNSYYYQKIGLNFKF